MKTEWTNLEADEFNTLSFVNNPSHFLVFRNEAEIYYHPAENRSQAFFLRLKTYNNAEKYNNEAFYQLQLGYSVSI